MYDGVFDATAAAAAIISYHISLLWIFVSCHLLLKTQKLCTLGKLQDTFDFRKDDKYGDHTIMLQCIIIFIGVVGLLIFL
ncbi:MAG: hypothetical protein ACI8RD_004442 [Bacillariaceae sp.]|jgi:hypothetical protein